MLVFGSGSRSNGFESKDYANHGSFACVALLATQLVPKMQLCSGPTIGTTRGGVVYSSRMAQNMNMYVIYSMYVIYRCYVYIC